MPTSKGASGFYSLFRLMQLTSKALRFCGRTDGRRMGQMGTDGHMGTVPSVPSVPKWRAEHRQLAGGAQIGPRYDSRVPRPFFLASYLPAA